MFPSHDLIFRYFSSSSYEIGKIPEGEELKKLQEALNKKAQEERKNQSQTFNLSTGKEYRERWDEMTDQEKGRFESFEDWEKKAKAWNKENQKSLTITATYKPDVKNDLTQAAKPVKDKIGTNLEDGRIITGYTANPRYDPTDPQGMKEQGIKKMLPVYADTQERVATKEDTDDTVTIGEDFDKGTLDIAVTEQIDEKKKAREQNNQ
jgi:hypothetical protein